MFGTALVRSTNDTTKLTILSGVAAGMKEPIWLKDGQKVEIEIEKIGKIANKLVFY